MTGLGQYLGMENRLEQLEAWGVPQILIRMADGKLPHPAFAAQCEPLRFDERWHNWGLQLERSEVRFETGGREAAALWEHDVGDGHAVEIVYCANTAKGPEYWQVMYADDMPDPESCLVARAEQGLYFWLFFFMIRSEFFLHGERAYSSLAAAAKAVHFHGLLEVFRLEEEIGSDDARRGELTQRSVAIR